MKFVYFGTSKFSATILNELINIGYKPNLVITQPDKPAGRGQILKQSPVAETATKHKINLVKPEKLNQDFLKTLAQFNNNQFSLQIENRSPERLGILAAYGKIIPQNVLNFFEPLGIINIHPSLLPKYRGPAPLQQAIINGDEKTGVTLIKLTNKVDAGPIIASLSFKIENFDTTETLEQKCVWVAIKLLKENLPLYLKGQIKLKPQDESRATYTNFIEKKQAQINWLESAKVIERKIRAYQPWPIAWFVLNNLRVQVLKASVLTDDKSKNYKIGQPLIINKKLCFKTIDDFICLEKLKPAGKKEMSAEEFVRGYFKQLKI
jgi:methionyl-tRNA formyltransferase